MTKDQLDQALPIIDKLAELQIREDKFNEHIAGFSDFKINLVIVSNPMVQCHKADYDDCFTPHEISQIFMMIDELREKERADLEQKFAEI